MSSVAKVRERVGCTTGDRSASAAADAEQVRLVRRVQAGDSSAYEKLVRMHQHRLLMVIGGILRRNEDVEDVAQQALVKAYISLNQFDLRSSFRTWLYKIAVNECWNYLRRKKARPLLYEADLSEEQVQHLDSIPEHAGGALRIGQDAQTQAEQRDLLDQLFRELDEQDQTILVMKAVWGFSAGEIAAALGLNVVTVRVRMCRARGRLVEIYRRRLEHRGTSRFSDSCTNSESIRETASDSKDWLQDSP
jgi:RNA polymerase sigma-70 factor (ECF subfamily)